ncbi:hypothetical protein HW555_003987 [Spodoptera exigua]|uniref:Uncharacterized protein n=1 Tax=Spodoptera exigua TaxID=7107 RepID=A0A835L6J6_SPOEX|nr:hypothetical protein HW555_003987 [Spodoptera exigua]
MTISTLKTLITQLLDRRKGKNDFFFLSDRTSFKRVVGSRRCHVRPRPQIPYPSSRIKDTNSKSSVSAAPRVSANSKSSVSAAPRVSAYSKSSVSAAPRVSAYSKSSASAAPRVSAYSKSSASAAPRVSANSKSSVSAAPRVSAYSKSSASAAPRVSANSKSSVSAAPRVSAYSKSSASAAPRVSANSKSSASAAPRVSANSKSSVSAVPSVSANSKFSVSAVPKESACSKSSASTAPKKPIYSKPSESPVPEKSKFSKSFEPALISTSCSTPRSKENIIYEITSNSTKRYVPHVSLRTPLNNRSLTFLVDTGSAVSLIKSKAIKSMPVLQNEIIHLKGIDNTNETIPTSDIKRDNEAISYLMSHQIKRSALLGVIGTLSKKLFGTMDEEDAIRYDNAIHEIQTDTSKIASTLKENILVTTSTLKSYNNTLETIKTNEHELNVAIDALYEDIKNLTYISKELGIRSRILELTSMLENSLLALSFKVEDIMNSVMFAIFSISRSMIRRFPTECIMQVMLVLSNFFSITLDTEQDISEKSKAYLRGSQASNLGTYLIGNKTMSLFLKLFISHRKNEMSSESPRTIY